MELSRLIGLGVLLTRLARGTGGESANVIREENQTPSGTVFDIYRHRRKKRATWVLVHGITVHGRKEPRLINFARTLARSGVTCVVPTLEGMAACRWETGDLDALAEVIVTTAENIRGPVGLMGFSFGGSYCLTAAGREETAKHVAHVIGFGAYHSLERLLESYAVMTEREPQSVDEWDDIIYSRLALLHGYGNNKKISPDVRQGIESLLNRYCTEASAEEKKSFYDRYLQGLDISGVIAQAVKPGICRELSPAGNMKGLTCPVTLIHDRNDAVTPPVHAERLLAELHQLSPSKRYRLVLTSLLSHVSSARKLNIRDGIRFARAMSPVLGF